MTPLVIVFALGAGVGVAVLCWACVRVGALAERDAQEQKRNREWYDTHAGERYADSHENYVWREAGSRR